MGVQVGNGGEPDGRIYKQRRKRRNSSRQVKTKKSVLPRGNRQKSLRKKRTATFDSKPKGARE